MPSPNKFYGFEGFRIRLATSVTVVKSPHGVWSSFCAAFRGRISGAMSMSRYGAASRRNVTPLKQPAWPRMRFDGSIIVPKRIDIYSGLG